jgi:ABC-type Fe3+-siderophore transport system, permease component
MELTRTNNAKWFWTAAAVLIVLFLANIFIGSVRLPFGEVLNILLGGEASKPTWGYIILQSRLPQAVTALFAGAALAASGLMLQTVFNNPLASPSLLGITNGASLGVAVVMLFLGGTIGGSLAGFSLTGNLAVILGAFLGAALVLSVIILFSMIVRSNVMLLIIGLMVGYLASSVISLLNFFATAEGVFHYTIWGMGNFSGVAVRHLPFFCISITIGLLIALLLVKPMNALLLGERYAANLGVKVRSVRVWMLVSTGILVAVTTAFCGPVAFIGLAVPHIVRLLTGTSNHQVLLPLTLLTGGIIALLCNLITVLPPNSVIPLNAVTPLVGAPVIIYVIINQKRIQYFH